MKLIYCPHCDDVRKLQYTLTTCECGRSFGQYAEDGLNACYGGAAIPVGFANSSFIEAIKKQPQTGLGRMFRAFIIPRKCLTYRKIQ